MFKITKKSIEWAGRTLTIETGQIARQADGAVLCTYGDTTVLATAVGAKTAKENQDFFPLTVHYQEKTYAAGKIPGGFFKREGRPSEKETLTSRLIDRPIRPLFIEGFNNEVQVVCTVISFDLENDPDIVALIAASAALTLSGMPFRGPIAAARIGYVDDKLVVNPLMSQMEESKLDLIAASTKDAVMMVESEAFELSPEKMLEAVKLAKDQATEVIDLIIAVAQEAAKEAWNYQSKDLKEIETQVEKLVGSRIEKAYEHRVKQDRVAALTELKEEITNKLCGDEEGSFKNNDVIKVIKAKESNHVRGLILNEKLRIDGRKLDEIRQIECTPRIIPRTHGSALFTRGETQALVITTLGTGDDEQMIDQLDGLKKGTFMLHYNFPPYSVGETGRLGTPGRREIGHGKLAWRAIRPVLPSQDEFPYVLRVVSEITESNGSSSMATVCGASLSLMDAGVPLKNHVAGIAMGLILENDKYAVLSDILGDEDHLGDMDFKVAGTVNGITSLQMDIKIAGITDEIMKMALSQAGEGIKHILGIMSGSLSSSRSELGEYAPRIETMNINPSKIREVIGSGGKVIREIVETTGAKIDISDDGLIKIASSDKDTITKAIDWIKSITDEPVAGTIYKGKIVKTVDFGAFVNFFGARDGLVHISQLAATRVKNVNDVVSEGQEVYVKFIGSDDRGKVRLSMKVVDQETGKEMTSEEE